MTIVQRARITSGAWTEWPDPPRAILRASVWCAGRTTAVIDDIASEIARKLPWGEYGVTIFPESTLPLDTPDGGEARLEIGGLVIMTDQNQPAPGFEQGSPHPSVSEVRLRFEQPISQDLADRPELLRRRDEVADVFGGLYGRIDGDLIRASVAVPRPVTGRGFSAAYSPAYG